MGTGAELDAFIAFAYQDSTGTWKIDDNAAAMVKASAGYQYTIDLPAKTYYTLATIDDNQNGQFFEDGERTGFWRNVDDFEPLTLAVQQVLTGISYDLVPLAPVDDTPSLVVGSACGTDTDCPDGGRCVTAYPGGYCTRDCQSQACPSGSKCYTVDAASGTKACIATCTGPSQGQSTCRSSYVCYDDESGGGQCLPNCRVLDVCAGSTTPTCNTNGYCQ